MNKQINQKAYSLQLQTSYLSVSRSLWDTFNQQRHLLFNAKHKDIRFYSRRILHLRELLELGISRY